MKYLLLTTIAAVVLVGCGESQQSAKDIWEAAKQGDVDAVKQFIVDGEDVNARKASGDNRQQDTTCQQLLGQAIHQ